MSWFTIDDESHHVGDLKPKSITFCVEGKDILTLTKDGIFADKDVRVGEAAKAVFEALEPYWKQLQPEKVEWRPIETAPKDGTRFLACEYPTMYVTFWDQAPFTDQRSWWWQENKRSGPIRPTHWMPLPALPKIGTL